MTTTAMGFHLWGIDHHHAPTEVRERVHIDPEKARVLIEALTTEDGVVSALPLSTCNRTEIYIETRGTEVDPALVLRALARAGIDGSLFLGAHGVRLSGLEVARHLYRVTAGLESMMLGEAQITGQVKDAYRMAREIAEFGPVTLRAFQGAFRASKRVRSQTRVSEGAVSVAFAAVELARKFFARLDDHQALLVGAGETGDLVARHLLQHGIGALAVANRSPARAQALVDELNEFCGDRTRSRPFEDLVGALAEVDLVVSTTGSLEPIILPDMVRAAQARRGGKPIFLLDIAVPRDVHPDVGGLDEVYLFGLDDLDEIVQANLAARRRELPKAEKVVEKELREFEGWVADMGLRPTVTEFRAYLEELKEREVGLVRKKESAEVAAAVDASLQKFIQKVMRRPVWKLRTAENGDIRERDLTSLRRLFELDRDEESESDNVCT